MTVVRVNVKLFTVGESAGREREAKTASKSAKEKKGQSRSDARRESNAPLVLLEALLNLESVLPLLPPHNALQYFLLQPLLQLRNRHLKMHHPQRLVEEIQS